MRPFVEIGIAVCFVALGLGIKGADAFKGRDGRECAPRKPEWKVCESDEDCTLVQGYCYKHAVNRAFADEAYERHYGCALAHCRFSWRGAPEAVCDSELKLCKVEYDPEIFEGDGYPLENLIIRRIEPDKQ